MNTRLYNKSILISVFSIVRHGGHLFLKLERIFIKANIFIANY